MSKRKPKRVIYRVVWLKRTRIWSFTLAGAAWGFPTKYEAVANARAQAKHDWRKGQPAQVMVHRKDGKFQIEYSYGCDNQKRKG